MADDTTDLVRQNLRDLTEVVGRMQQMLHALFYYLAEQPSFDAARYLALLDRERKGLPPETPKDTELSRKFLAFLKDFQGPIQ